MKGKVNKVNAAISDFYLCLTMILLLDNFDSFTYILNNYLVQAGFETLVKRNNEISVSDIETLMPEAIVLSPGPNTPAESGIMMDSIHHFHKRLPMLGVCLGHQAIGQYFGASLIRAANPMHGKTSMVLHQNHFLFQEIPSPFQAMRYHSLILNQIENTTLQVIASTPENEIMAIAHPELPILGVQFHPESILTQMGLQMIVNWKKNLPSASQL